MGIPVLPMLSFVTRKQFCLPHYFFFLGFPLWVVFTLGPIWARVTLLPLPPRFTDGDFLFPAISLDKFNKLNLYLKISAGFQRPRSIALTGRICPAV